MAEVDELVLHLSVVTAANTTRTGNSVENTCLSTPSSFVLDSLVAGNQSWCRQWLPLLDIIRFEAFMACYDE